jgi:para-aminobenzoate synthetase component 1
MPSAASPSAPESGASSPAGSAADLLLRWPREVPLAALVSGGEERAQNAWTILARPSRAVVIDGGLDPREALAMLDAALAETPRGRAAGPNAAEADDPESGEGGRTPPFDGGWIVAFGYSLGGCFEPHGAGARRGMPHAVLLWCDDAWCMDHADGSLHAVGSPPPLGSVGTAQGWSVRDFGSDTDDTHYAANVARVVEYIRAGDAFQANLARRFSGRISGDLRSFAHAAIAENRAWFGASLDLPGGQTLVSMSPELFLRVHPDGTVVTRPIKGTRPASVDARELDESGKDRAELAMIVDLMRNDLGRVAEIGSVRVTAPRVLETHRTVHHGVAEISARLRPDVGWRALLAATFPPGSVTGAPKVRAMQIIEELEPHARGFYCGAIGFIARSGHAALNVAIRTAQVGAVVGSDAVCPPSAVDADGTGRYLCYHAGCGIVADSDPSSELEETYAKVRAIEQLVASASE